MTKVTIDRELLERELLSVLDFSESNLRRVVDHLIDVGYTLAAPRQPEGEGLEVVAWQDAENPLYTTAERRVLHDWVNNGYPIVELCRLSDHQRAIAELREECEIQRNTAAGAHNQLTANRLETEQLAKDWMAVVAERDTLRQQIDERDAAIEEWSGTAVHNGMECDRLAAQRDKLAGLLREVGDWIDRTSFHGTDAVDLMQRIDAALAEVNK